MTKDIAVRTATAVNNPPSRLVVWKELEAHFEKIKDLHLRADPKLSHDSSTNNLISYYRKSRETV